MSSNLNLAIVGATGNVGSRVISILGERSVKIENLFPIASRKSLGKKILFNKKEFPIEDLESFDFRKCNVVIFAAGSTIAEKYIPLASRYAICIDNSSLFRMKDGIPLIIPEVNSHKIFDVKKTNIISNPNCSTSQAVVPLKIIKDLFGLKSIVYSTYQSVSGAGVESMKELIKQSKKILDCKESDLLYGDFSYNEKTDPKSRFSFNIIPQIDTFLEDGSTKEERKMEEETKKILEINIPIHANCARVPVLIGHSEYINVETEKKVDIEKLRREFSKSSAIKIIDNIKANEYATPDISAGRDEIFVSRIRKNNATENGLSFWCVCDNLKKGAALNNVQILELLIKEKLF